MYTESKPWIRLMSSETIWLKVLRLKTIRPPSLIQEIYPEKSLVTRGEQNQ